MEQPDSPPRPSEFDEPSAREAVAPPAESEPAARWSFPRRFLLRLALLYLLLYTHPFPIDLIPDPATVAETFDGHFPYHSLTDPVFEGIRSYSEQATSAERALVDWTAERAFGFEHTLDRPYDSGDPTYSYVLLCVQLALAFLLALVWSVLARGSRPLTRLAAWLQLAARYALAFPLLGYGFAKVFPSQFRAPGLARLVSDFGDSSPMNVLWTFMGSSQAYTVFAGAGEVLAGLLLCFRRTATLGALVATAVMGNVVALNFCYDVPVKLDSLHLLSFALLLLLPDMRRLLRVFLLNRPAPARDLRRPRFPLGLGHLVKLLVVGTSVAIMVTRVVRSYEASDAPGPHYGIWDVESFREVAAGGVLPDQASAPWHALLLERETGGNGYGWIQLDDHGLRAANPQWQDERRSLTLSGMASWSYRLDGESMILQGEFQRTFRADPTNFQDPGEPRAPQVELVLQRAEQPAAAPELTPEAGSQANFPAELVGRWMLKRQELIGTTATRRRTDPAGWTGVTLSADGKAVFEYEGGLRESYRASVEAERGTLRFGWSSQFDVEQLSADSMILRGAHRGRTLDIQLTRRDLNSFLLLRRGFHWINEVPLNRY